ncbi:MAG: tetratricopeptide repeat protein, partial [Alphaproteobacteria bacterium]|nr:tetratricopeptide repeat protein [Alphaproteobacteria bacterium]
MTFQKVFGAAAIASSLILGSAATTSVAFAQTELTDQQIDETRKTAQNAFSEGRPEEALSLIEKVIIASPADLSARFFRAQILVALGRGAEIREELVLMSSLNLPEEDIKRAKKLIAAIDKDGSRLSGKASISLGLGYTDNANSWPKNGSYTSGSGLVVALPDPVYDQSKKQTDTLRKASVSVYGTYDITEARDLVGDFNFSASIDDGSTTVNKDKKTYSAGGGISYTFPTGTGFKVGGSVASIDRVNYHNDSNVSTDIDQTSYNVAINQQIGPFGTGIRHVSSTSDASKLETADQSDATTVTNSIFVGAPFGKTMYFRGTLSAGESRSDATKDIEASRKKVDKDTSSFNLIAVKVLPHSQRLVASASVSETKFKSNYVGDNILRKDTTNSLTLKYTIEGEELLDMLTGYELGSSLSMSSTSSNQESSKVTANTLMFTISRRF